MHKPLKQQKGGSSFQSSRTAGDRFQRFTPNTGKRNYSLPYNSFSCGLQKRTDKVNLLPALPYRYSVRGFPKLAKGWSSLAKFLSFSLSCSVSLLGGRSILYPRTIMQNSRVRPHTESGQRGIPNPPVFHSEAQGVWLLQDYTTRESAGEQPLVPDVTSIPPS